MIEIAEGDARDIAAIMPVMDDAFDPLFGESWNASQCLAALSMPNCRLVFARNNSAIIGFAISRWVLDEEELLMIAVSRHHQRQGVSPQGYSAMWLTMRARRTGALCSSKSVAETLPRPFTKREASPKPVSARTITKAAMARLP